MIEAKYIPGTDYLVYSDGRIWSNKTHRFMKQCSNGRYMKVALCIKGKLKQFLVHRLVAKAFVPNPENKREVNHIDGNKTNNKVSNLEWVTARENQIHAVKTGLKKHGTDLWNGKFNKEQVVDIIKQHQNGASCYALGRKYGCGATTISAICRGLRYKQYFQKKELQHILWTLGLNANLKILKKKMKKIMFSDKYRLTDAVLIGRKTQTRRILNPTMLFERLNTYEGWTKESIADWKESCKDRLYKAEGEELKEMLDYALEHSLYKVGENVAIAQRYIDLADNDEFYRLCGIHGMPLECIKFEKGCKNKMFVKADLMPHHIRITRIRVERLQDISEEDCLAEGIWEAHNIGLEGVTYWYTSLINSPYLTAKEAYAALIDKISGKGTWKSNPYVFVYDFELID